MAEESILDKAMALLPGAGTKKAPVRKAQARRKSARKKS